MKCKNCGKNDANFMYTKIINGEKQEFILCDECAKKLGIETWNHDFSMPIDFASFLGDFWNEDENIFLNPFENKNEFKCLNCGMTFDEFLNKGKFGCSNCYSIFENKLDEVIKQIQGAKKHIGKRAKQLGETQNEKTKKEKIVEDVKDEKQEKLNELKEKLKIAINEERYEDAANLRDKIKLLEKEE